MSANHCFLPPPHGFLLSDLGFLVYVKVGGKKNPDLHWTAHLCLFLNFILATRLDLEMVLKIKCLLWGKRDL